MSEAPVTKTKGEQTRDRIVDQSLRLIARQGFTNTTIQQIADACDITQPAIFKHFKNRQELFAAVRKRVSLSNHEMVDGRTDVTDNGLEALLKHCVGNIEWAVAHKDQAQIIILSYYQAFFDEDARAVYRGVIETGKERMRKYILAGQREGVIKDENAEKLAIVVHEYVLGMFLRTVPGATEKTLAKKDRERLISTIRAMVSAKPD